MASENADLDALRAVIEERHTKWIKTIEEHDTARVRAKELAWVLRLIDGNDDLTLTHKHIAKGFE